MGWGICRAHRPIKQQQCVLGGGRREEPSVFPPDAHHAACLPSPPLPSAPSPSSSPSPPLPLLLSPCGTIKLSQSPGRLLTQEARADPHQSPKAHSYSLTLSLGAKGQTLGPLSLSITPWSFNCFLCFCQYNWHCPLYVPSSHLMDVLMFRCR